MWTFASAFLFAFFQVFVFFLHCWVCFLLMSIFLIYPLSFVNFGVDWHIGNIYVVSVEQWISFEDDDDEEWGL